LSLGPGVVTAWSEYFSGFGEMMVLQNYFAQVAISMACRLRFCRRLEGADEGTASPTTATLAAAMDQLDLDTLLR
jgi:hypothetical protein